MEHAIFTLENAAMERWRNGDPFGFVEQSADDIIYVDPGLTQPILGRADYAESMKQVQGKIYYHKSEFIQPRLVVEVGRRQVRQNLREGERVDLQPAAGDQRAEHPSRNGQADLCWRRSAGGCPARYRLPAVGPHHPLGPERPASAPRQPDLCPGQERGGVACPGRMAPAFGPGGD